MTSQTAAQGTSRPKELVLRLYTEALNQARYEQVVDDVVAADAVTHDGLARGVTGPEGTKRTMRALHEAFTDMAFIVDDILADGDRVAVRWHMSGTHTGPFAGQPATGRPLIQRGTVLYRIEDDMVAEIWPLVDRLGLLQQVTAAPAESPSTRR